MVGSLAGTASKPSEPQRTCVGCRTVAPRAALLRIVAVHGVATPDPARRLPGRGANVHADPACIVLSIRRKSLHRALRVPDLRCDDLMGWSASANTDRRQSPAQPSVESSGANGMSAR